MHLANLKWIGLCGWIATPRRSSSIADLLSYMDKDKVVIRKDILGWKSGASLYQTR